MSNQQDRDNAQQRHAMSMQYATPSRPEHQHQFTIPVEWEYQDERGRQQYARVAIRKVVTKLRCSGCAEEEERK